MWALKKAGATTRISYPHCARRIERCSPRRLELPTRVGEEMVEKILAWELSRQFGIDRLTDNQFTLLRGECEGSFGLITKWSTRDEQIEQDV